MSFRSFAVLSKERSDSKVVDTPDFLPGKAGLPLSVDEDMVVSFKSVVSFAVVERGLG